MYVPLNKRSIGLGDLDVELINKEGKSVGLWRVYEPFFLGADDVSLSYASNDTMKYSLTFGADIIKFIKYEVSPIPFV
jgi:hypothetical protein